MQTPWWQKELIEVLDLSVHQDRVEQSLMLMIGCSVKNRVLVLTMKNIKKLIIFNI